MVSRSVRRLFGVAVAAVLVGSMAGPAPAAARGDRHRDPAKQLTRAVQLSGLLEHIRAFQRIADANGGNRASGQPGYDRSADYVARRLERAGYLVTRQPFEFPFFEEFGSTFAQLAPVPTTYVDGTDYDLTEYSGDGTAEGLVVPVDVNLAGDRASNSGCEESDFAGGIVEGRIALMQRGTCAFGIKVANAEAAGAIGAIVFNQGNVVPGDDRLGVIDATLGAPVDIPAVTISFDLGAAFVATAATPGGVTVRITADTTSEVRSTQNVLAESRHGNAENVVMAGAHLDSEPDTAGINDNGSGSAALLEVALQMARKHTPNKVRFAWWGAEEAGLRGSTFYVGQLEEEAIADIALYLNFDMIASPNYIFGVYDGDDSAGEGSGPGPAGSAAIEDVFEAFFAARNLATRPADFSGRSDYGPFIAAGVDIPAGGLFTGAEGLKTAEEVALYGGVAGAQYDPCYHDPCDSLRPVRDGADAALYAQLDRGYRLYGNLNLFAFDVNADAMATAVITFAYDTSSVTAPAAPAAATRAAPAVPSRSVDGALIS